MCLHPRIMKNKKYLPNKKNNYKPPKITDERVKYVAVGCGNCIECMNQRKRNWQIRLHEEIKNDNTGKFVTLTFSEESITELTKAAKTTEANQIATLAVRRFLERWRKKHKKSVKHWLVTELGHKGTERIHLHGIIFTEKTEDIKTIWRYGNIWIGDYVNGKTINYIVKYMTKQDKTHKDFKGKVLCSKGLGRKYTKRTDAKNNKYKEKNTNQNYRLPNGAKVPLPTYYRNKIYTEDEREKLWIELLEKEERYVLGQRIDVSTIKGEKEYEQALKWAQSKNKRLGYGGIKRDIKKYNARINLLKKKK